MISVRYFTHTHTPHTHRAVGTPIVLHPSLGFTGVPGGFGSDHSSPFSQVEIDGGSNDDHGIELGPDRRAKTVFANRLHQD